MFRIVFFASCATVRFSCWLTTMTLVFTVKAIRAPMGTKATPTASLSIFMTTRIHDVDARSAWCQLGGATTHVSARQTLRSPSTDHSPEAPSRFVFTFPLMSDGYGFVNGTEGRWHARSDELASRWGSPLFRLETNSNWGTCCAGGGCDRGGKAVYCHCDDPDILEQPRGASLFAWRSAGF